MESANHSSTTPLFHCRVPLRHKHRQTFARAVGAFVIPSGVEESHNLSCALSLLLITRIIRRNRSVILRGPALRSG
jgi:hypothetical protein